MSDEGTDAQIATGDAGQQAEDMANNLIGEQSPAEAVYFYGLYSLAMGGGFVLLVTKEPNDKEGLQAALDSIVHTFSLHGACGTPDT